MAIGFSWALHLPFREPPANFLHDRGRRSPTPLGRLPDDHHCLPPISLAPNYMVVKCILVFFRGRSIAAKILTRAPFSAVAFLSNEEVNHRIVFFGMHGLAADSDKDRHARLQHVAFECETFDDLLGTYARLKRLGIVPLWAADHGVGTGSITNILTRTSSSSM